MALKSHDWYIFDQSEISFRINHNLKITENLSNSNADVSNASREKLANQKHANNLKSFRLVDYLCTVCYNV